MKKEKNIEIEKDKKWTLFQRIKEYRKVGIGYFKILLLCLGIDSSILIGTMTASSEIEKIRNGKIYEKEIKEYNKEIKDYANKTKKMNLSDIATIMKVTNDMWENIYAYGKPTMDVDGYLALDMKKDGIGVCRNMADDIANKLNKINPDYNARLVTGYFKYANPEPNEIQSRTIQLRTIIKSR